MVENYMNIFIDDLIVFRNFFDKCLDNFERVLKKCKKKRLVLNQEKCHFITTFGIVFGHIMSFNGIEVDKTKVEDISKLFLTKIVREVYSFLGHVSFYMRFINDFRSIFRLPCNLLIKDTPFQWTENCQKAFKKIINLLTSKPYNAIP